MPGSEHGRLLGPSGGGQNVENGRTRLGDLPRT
jgi:hypothetical protein